jgi:hypothetical protein
LDTPQDQLDASAGQEAGLPAHGRSPQIELRRSRFWGFALAAGIASGLVAWLAGEASHLRRSRFWGFALAAGIASGLVAWLAGEASHDLFKSATRTVNSKGMIALKITDRREAASAAAWNSALTFMLLGATLGAAMGVAGGLARRSRSAAGRAALIGLTAGACGSVAMSALLLPPYNIYKQRNPDEAARDLVLPVLVHAAIWATAGAAAGAAFGVGLGSDRAAGGRLLTGGLLGAAVAAVVYELVGAVVFTSATTAQFVSETWQPRLFASLIMTLFTAIGLALSLRES